MARKFSVPPFKFSAEVPARLEMADRPELSCVRAAKLTLMAPPLLMVPLSLRLRVPPRTLVTMGVVRPSALFSVSVVLPDLSRVMFPATVPTKVDAPVM